MNFLRITLTGTKDEILSDIRSLQYKGEAVYPKYPEGYEFREGKDVFIVTDIYHKQMRDGEDLSNVVLSENYYCHLILPENYDTSHLLNICNE